MKESFRMRIGSCSEKLSSDFAFAILPYLEHVSGQEFNPSQITLEQYRTDCRFLDVRSWSWPSSIENLRELVKKDSNVIVLSQHFLDWETQSELFNDEMDGFEEELEAKGVSVITIEAYSKEQEANRSAQFDKVNIWHKATINRVLTEMLDGYLTESLCLPYGAIPYIQLHPEMKDMGHTDGKRFRALVGFQPWQYEKVLSRWPIQQFPLIHEIGKLKWEPVSETGSIPMSIRF